MIAIRNYSFRVTALLVFVSGCTSVFDVNPGDSFQADLSFKLVLFSKSESGEYIDCPQELIEKIPANATLRLDVPSAATITLEKLTVEKKDFSWSSSGHEYRATGIQLNVAYRGQVTPEATVSDVYIHLELPELKEIATIHSARPGVISVSDNKQQIGTQRNLHLVKRDTEGSVAVGMLKIHKSSGGKAWAYTWKTLLGLACFAFIAYGFYSQSKVFNDK